MIFRLLRGVLRTIRVSSRLLVLLLFIGLIGLNVATLVSDTVFSALSSIVSALTDRPTIAKSHAAVRDERDRDRQAKQRLERRIAQQSRIIRSRGAALTTSQRNLAISRSELNTIRQDLSATQRNLATTRNNLSTERARSQDLDTRMAAQKSKAREVATRIRNRIAPKAVSSVGTVFLEAVPYFGIAVIIAEASTELYVACEIMSEADELLTSLDAEPADEETAKICGMHTPDFEEVWGSVHVWSKAQWEEGVRSLGEIAPEFPDISIVEIPDIGIYEWISWANSFFQ